MQQDACKVGEFHQNRGKTTMSHFTKRLIVAAMAMLTSAHAAAQSESARLHALFDAEWEWTMRTFPEFATSVGYPGQDDRWTDMSFKAIEARQDHARETLDRTSGIERGALDAIDRLNYDLFRQDAELTVEGLQYPGHLLAIDQLSGVQQDLASTISRMRAASVDEYEDILARLRTAPRRIEQEMALLKKGLEEGVTQPRITLRDVAEQVANQIVDDPQDSPLYLPFAAMPESIPSDEQQRLRDAAREIIADDVLPAFASLKEFLKEEYIPNARETIAASDLPDGENWYAFNVRVRTTTDLTPDEIHQLGLSEVARIRGEMNEIIAQLEFDGDFQDFCEHLRTDPQFYYDDPQELIIGYRDIAKRIDPELPSLFGTLPRLPYGVREVPEYAEKSQTTAYYQPGSPVAGRAGYFFANTYKLETRPKWEMEALTVHEAVPGHHLQIAIAQELEGVPEFRKFGGPTAFVEGWGLYSESLGEEIGLYRDSYSKFGQLTYEIWRAIRLVVDTGMHAKGWTRQQAIDYFAANSCKQLHDITVEIDRYIVWPGQALAYKLGELKFKELRRRASESLGDAFDIREFHDVLLENGALPLDLIEARVNAWLEAKQAE